MWGARVKTPVDMPDDMIRDLIQTSTSLLSSCEDLDGPAGDKSLQDLKRYLDGKWNPNWHVVVGKNFGAFVTHETRCFIYFYFMEKAIMIYKAG